MATKTHLMADIKENTVFLIHLHDKTPVHLSGTASFLV